MPTVDQPNRSFADSTDNGGLTRATAGLTPEQRQIVIDNLGLVHHIVARVSQRFPSAMNRDDLVQTGTMGLIEAVTRFDPERGSKFSTFAGRRIEGAITDHLRSGDWAPRSVRAQQRRLHRAEANGAHTDEELSRLTGMNPETIRRTRAEVNRATLASFDSSSFDRNQVIDRSRPVDTGLLERETISELRAALRLLPDRHRLLVEAHFLDGRTLTEIGEAMGVTQSRASQLKAEALADLRRIMSRTA